MSELIDVGRLGINALLLALAACCSVISLVPAAGRLEGNAVTSKLLALAALALLAASAPPQTSTSWLQAGESYKRSTEVQQLAGS